MSKVSWCNMLMIHRFYTIDNLDQIIKDTEDTLMKCRRYFLRNGLMFNSSKTQLICITPPNTTIIFNGNIIHPSKHVKNLGIYFNRYMIFDTHINELNKKVMGNLMYISIISGNLL